MRIYFAPMENITGYVHRNAHHRVYPGIDKYYAPFISPTPQGTIKEKELLDILPENNEGILVVPQLLTNKAEDFRVISKQLASMGYDEVNLNLGCPSATVVSKGRGSGFLAHKEQLKQFLDEIFESAETKISIKTRIGVQNPDEFYELLEIFNNYRMEELIIHPRVREEFYRDEPHHDMFRYAMAHSTNKLCYNGNLFTREQYNCLEETYPELESVMVGRGILTNPELVAYLRQEPCRGKIALQQFHDALVEQYREVLDGDSFVVTKMKQFWFYVRDYFYDETAIWDRIKRCRGLEEYERIILDIFKNEQYPIQYDKGHCPRN